MIFPILYNVGCKICQDITKTIGSRPELTKIDKMFENEETKISRTRTDFNNVNGLLFEILRCGAG